MMAALILSWLPVALDCAGHAELSVTYSVWTEAIVKTGTQTDADGNTWNVERRDFLAAVTSNASMMLAEPAEGGGIFWRDPVAVDASGNRSDDPGGCSP
jgi:hypothetical protein